MFLKLLECGKQEWQENVSESINNHIKKYFSYYCFISLNFTVLHSWVFILNLRSSDVQVSQGPDYLESSTDFNDYHQHLLTR